MSFDSKVVIVTGSSSGIGAAAAIAFAKQGASIVIVGRNEEKMKNVSNKCESFGKKPLVIKADVSKDDEAKKIIDETMNKFGKIDVLVNNAGGGEAVDITSDDFMASYDRLMRTNLRAPVYLTHLVIPFLITTKGNIVNISSGSAHSNAIPVFIPYSTSKAQLNHFSRSVALKLAEHEVRVNIVSPGPVRTDALDNLPGAKWEDFYKTTALKRVSDPEEIADLILFLASDKARGITGSEFVTDNGFLVQNK